MALKQVRVLYQARNFQTGLTDVKGQVYVDQAAKAVGASAISFSELDATNAPGVYFAVLSAAVLAGFSAVAGSALEVVINSASKPAEAAYKEILTAISSDDLDAHLTTQDGTLSSISSSLGTVSTNVSAVKSDLETGPNSLATISAAIAAVQSAVSAIQNTTNFTAAIPEPLVRPASGSNTFRIPIRLFNDKGQMADADTNSILVSVANQAGTDRGSILTGYSAGSAPAVRDASGVYHIDMAIASTTVLEGLVFSFTYAVGGIAFNQGRAGSVVSDVQADGFALQATLVTTQTTVNNSDAILMNAGYGLSAANTLQTNIQTLLTSGSYGLSALQSLLANGTYGLSAIQAILTNATYGLPNLKTGQDAIAANVTTANSALIAIEGSGFVGATDSLSALSSRVFSGGRAL